VDLDDELARAALDRVAAGLVVGFAGRDVLLDLSPRQRAELHFGARHRKLDALVVLEHQRRQHLVPAPREPGQHFGRLDPVGRLGEDAPVDRNRGIGRQHRRARQAALLHAKPAAFGLGTTHPDDVVMRRFARMRVLAHLGLALGTLAKEQQVEAHADLRKEFAPAGAARGKVDAAVLGGDHSLVMEDSASSVAGGSPRGI